MLSKISQSQKDKYYMTPLIYELSKIVRSIESIKRKVVTREGLWRLRICSVDIKLKLYKMNKFNNTMVHQKHFKMINLVLTVLTIHTHTQVHKETIGGDRCVYYFDSHDVMVEYQNCIH